MPISIDRSQTKTFAAWMSIISLVLWVACKYRPSFKTVESGKSLLWQVSGKGLTRPSYFLGTMHLMCEDDAALSNNVKTIIGNADSIYLEVDMDNAAELLTGFLDIFKQKNNSLQQVLSNAEYERIKAFFERYQPAIPFAALEKQPPMLLSASVYELLLPCEKKNGAELKIIDEAYRQKKMTKGLETMAFQAGIFDSIPFSEQAGELLKSIDSLDKNEKMMSEMLQVYKAQDIEKLFEISIGEDSSISNHADLLLYKRNENWVAQFPAIAAKSTILFAVGAGHLGGPRGVLNLLRKQGYTVRAIQN